MSTRHEVSRPRLVIAEDETLIRLDLAKMLAEEAYDVVGRAGDGQRAVGRSRSCVRPAVSSTSRCRSPTGSRRPVAEGVVTHVLITK